MFRVKCRGSSLGTAPHTVTVDIRATIKGLIYPYYQYYSTVAEWRQYPRFKSQLTLEIVAKCSQSVLATSAPSCHCAGLRAP